jgi:tellurite resistance protein
MNKVQAEQLRLARERKREIARKVQAQKLQASGYVRSQLSGLTSPDRLIECDHYMRKGADLARSHARDALEKSKKELKAAQGRKHTLVKWRDGKKEVERVTTK